MILTNEQKVLYIAINATANTKRMLLLVIGSYERSYISYYNYLQSFHALDCINEEFMISGYLKYTKFMFFFYVSLLSIVGLVANSLIYSLGFPADF